MEKLITRLAEHASVDPATIDASTTFESLGIDSLDTVELVMELEDELGIELELDESIETVGDFWAFIESNMN